MNIYYIEHLVKYCTNELNIFFDHYHLKILDDKCFMLLYDHLPRTMFIYYYAIYNDVSLIHIVAYTYKILSEHCITTYIK